MTTILVADDAAFVRLWCTKMLGRQGFEVVEALDGKDAVAKYRELKPDAVLLDVAMPELDGLGALRAIREIDPKARVMMLTGLGQRHIVLEALNAGARDFVVKPFKPERVLAAVKKLLADAPARSGSSAAQRPDSAGPASSGLNVVEEGESVEAALVESRESTGPAA